MPDAASSSPFALTDVKMFAILAAAHPLPPDRRSDFLVDVARELAALPIVGDGALHRVVMATQRKFILPFEQEHGTASAA